MLHFKALHFTSGQLKVPTHGGGTVEVGWLQLAAELSTDAVRSRAQCWAPCPDQLLCRELAGNSEFTDE